MTLDRKEWLANLKEGDEVCIDTTVIGGDNHQKITTITKITPTHKFKVDKDLFNEHGEHKINWTHSTLIPSTPEEKQGIRDRNRRHYVKNIDYSQVSQETIDKIYIILKDEAKTVNLLKIMRERNCSLEDAIKINEGGK